MFSSNKQWICSDDNAQTNSHYMDLYDVEIHEPESGSDRHLMDVVLDLRNEEKGTRHLLMLNAHQVIKAAFHLEDELGLDDESSNTITQALYLLERKARLEARRRALETN